MRPTHPPTSGRRSAITRLPVLALAAAAALGVASGSAWAQTTGGPQGAVPFANGSLSSLTGSTLKVAGRNGDSTVVVNGSTGYLKTTSATAADVAVGDCIRVSGTGSDTTGITATSVTLSKPQGKSGCTQTNPFGGGNRGTGQNGGTGPNGGSGRTGQGFGPPGGTLPNGQTFTPGQNGQGPGAGQTPSGTLPDGTTRPSFASANGTVKAVNGDQITVKAQIPQGFPGAGGPGGAPGTTSTTTATGSSTKSSSAKGSKKQAAATTQNVDVTLNSTTTLLQTVSTTQKDLAVGVCVAASGTADSVGTITAKTVTISQPVNGTCTGNGGFGGRPGGFGPRGQDGGTTTTTGGTGSTV